MTHPFGNNLFNTTTTIPTRRASDVQQVPRPFSTPQAPTSPISGKNNSKAIFFLFKKKDTLHNNSDNNGQSFISGPSTPDSSVSPSLPSSPVQLLPPQLPQLPTPRTLEEEFTTSITTKVEEADNQHFKEKRSPVSKTKLGSISVPNLLSLNELDLSAEYEMLMKQKLQQHKYSGPGQRKTSVMFEEQEKGFKTTMKKTMRKTSTFFRKLGGNKPHSDQNGRHSIPNFHDTESNEKSDIPRLTLNNSSGISGHDYYDEDRMRSYSDNEDLDYETSGDDGEIDENDILQETFKDFAIFKTFEFDAARRRNAFYRNSLLGANKSVPENLGRDYAFFDNNLNTDNDSKLLTNFLEPDDNRAIRGKTFSLPPMVNISSDIIMKIDKLNDNPNTSGLSSLGTKSIKPLPPIKVQENSSTETTKEVYTGGGGQPTSSLRNSSERESIFVKSGFQRQDANDTGTELVVGPSPTIPKRPNKKLPDLPKTKQIVNQPSAYCSPHTRQASSIASSSYETASGSTGTLHTAPPSPIASEDFADNNQITRCISNTISSDSTFATTSPCPPHVQQLPSSSPLPEVLEKNEDEVAWADARIAAQRCYEEDQTFKLKEQIAEFLGGNKIANVRTLKCYMEYYNFHDKRIDVAFRQLCARLYIKGEAQQVDRILEAFSRRYWECNQFHPKYSSLANVVHAISYALLLLNTDLHIAQGITRMSRSQFVKNTMHTVHSQISLIPPSTPITPISNNSSAIECDDDSMSIETNTTVVRPPRRSDSLKSWTSNPGGGLSAVSFMNAFNNSGFSSPPIYSRQWDAELENLLKAVYNSIKANQILQPLLSSIEKGTSSETTSPSPTIRLKRSESHLGHPHRLNVSLRENLKRRSMKTERNSPSPSLGSGGSDISLGTTVNHRSSTVTLGSNNTLHQQSFENISTISEKNKERDDSDNISLDSNSTTESLQLYLSGAPYAKEGNLVRKHYLESTNKRAKDKTWKECFVVVENGEIKMFKFDNHHNSNNVGGDGTVGGGNWMANATLLGEVNLRHSITNSLPPPGYNRDRPFVFALSLPNGGLYLFQAGTPEHVAEWVATCNYWAAMMSKEPLSGGVSNMEYGWNRCIDSSTSSFDIVEDWEDHRSVLSAGSYVTHNDRVNINEWKAPMPTMVSSGFKEDKQLAALKKYITDLENELEAHKTYREPMTRLYHPRSSNYTKAFANWEKKSQWLLYEIVKYTTYIESLENSVIIRARKRKEREKTKNADLHNKEESAPSSPLPTITTTITEEDQKIEKKRAEFRQSIRLLRHRATWTPGDEGFSLNLPKELLYEEADDEEDDADGEEVVTNSETSSRIHHAGSSGKLRSATYPQFFKDLTIQEDQKLENFLHEDGVSNDNVNNNDNQADFAHYESGQRWVDRFRN
ncbi:10067_t:CDS:10 [Ambispora gerdemannii]|uniref:10067_t:CDS:1 n=1 Tax=Ambispora gerdemannii TaxID=144530 RepID=A0A9N8WB68_9GLOM|nr:10067_t:CDS:10 [Ambispora gerdemannii]